jgi:uncharacterized protein (TIGR03435 family)
MLQFTVVRWLSRLTLVSAAILTPAYGQQSAAPAKTEFDAASIRISPPKTGFHFGPDSSSVGGPGTTDPGMFRCSNCTLATLISKAFDLQNYQFPGRASLGDKTFDVMARIPDGVTQEAFATMLQNLLKDRFSLKYHYTEKNVRGFHLVMGGNGSKLKESSDNGRPQPAEDLNNRRPNGSADQHGPSQGAGHTHNGLVSFGASSTYRGDHQTTGDLARLISDQLSVPVDDQTGLRGKYDIVLTWTGSASNSGHQADGAWGGAGHGDHGGGGGAPAASGGSGSRPTEASGPTIFEALQSQLGLKLVRSEQTVARILVIDHAEQLPTAN